MQALKESINFDILQDIHQGRERRGAGGAGVLGAVKHSFMRLEAEEEEAVEF